MILAENFSISFRMESHSVYLVESEYNKSSLQAAVNHECSNQPNLYPGSERRRGIIETPAQNSRSQSLFHSLRISDPQEWFLFPQ